MYIEKHMIKEIRRPRHKVFFSVYLSVYFVHVLEKNMIPFPDFLAFDNIVQCTYGPPNSWNLGSHVTFFLTTANPQTFSAVSLQILHSLELSVCRWLLLGTVTCLFWGDASMELAVCH